MYCGRPPSAASPAERIQRVPHGLSVSARHRLRSHVLTEGLDVILPPCRNGCYGKAYWNELSPARLGRPPCRSVPRLMGLAFWPCILPPVVPTTSGTGVHSPAHNTVLESPPRTVPASPSSSSTWGRRHRRRRPPLTAPGLCAPAQTFRVRCPAVFGVTSRDGATSDPAFCPFDARRLSVGLRARPGLAARRRRQGSLRRRARASLDVLAEGVTPWAVFGSLRRGRGGSCLIAPPHHGRHASRMRGRAVRRPPRSKQRGRKGSFDWVFSGETSRSR